MMVTTAIKLLPHSYLAHFPEFDNHKAVWSFSDRSSGLRGFIAIHNDNLGPAVGGTRYWPYENEVEALRDALRLSSAMSYKCALAGINFGGGKGVIIAPTKTIGKEILKAYAMLINSLGEKFYTGEDVGLTQADIDTLRHDSKFIIGSKERAGDPSPWAARSVFYSIKAAADTILHKSNLQQLTLAIKGLGKVGSELCRLLYREGIRIIGADINENKVKEARRRFPLIKIVEPAEIHKQKVDIYSPCALGNELTLTHIRHLRCWIICGGANNQLNSPESGLELFRRGIFYVSDYIANCGGLINVVDELNPGGYNRRRVARKVQGVYNRVRDLISVSLGSQTPPNVITDKSAADILNSK